MTVMQREVVEIEKGLRNNPLIYQVMKMHLNWGRISYIKLR